jgi:fructose-bisphosphate aldolase, class II
MSLVNGNVILRHAYEHGYAVPAYNGNTMDHALAIVAAAEAEEAPVFLQLSRQAVAHVGMELGGGMLRAVAERAGVPVAVHLDHGKSLAANAQALRAGCTSLMFDGSDLTYAENVAITRDVAAFAHACNVPVEAELGRVAVRQEALSDDQVQALFTDPDQAVDFVAQTGCDSLAVACGSVHRGLAQSVTLDLDRLEAVHRRVDLPLVLHGASGVTDDSARAAARHGVAKVNIATRFNRLFTATMRQSLADDPDEGEPTVHLERARQAMTAALRAPFGLLGAKGQARRY